MVGTKRLFAILALLTLSVSLGFATPAAAQAVSAPAPAPVAALPPVVESPDLVQAADRYVKVLQARTGAGKPDNAAALAARQRGDEHAKAKRWAQAVAEYETAIVRGLDDHRTWVELARALEQTRNDRASAAAHVALGKARTPVDRANALYIVARQFDRATRQRDALAVFDAAIALAPSRRR